MQLKYPSISAQISPDQQIYDGFTLLLQEKTKGLASNAKKKKEASNDFRSLQANNDRKGTIKKKTST